VLGVTYIMMNKPNRFLSLWGLPFHGGIRHEANKHKNKYIITNYSEKDKKRNAKGNTWL
jgi:hypothetical protein